MANWFRRKSSSIWNGSIRNTTTYTQNKGLTTSRSIGDKTYRTTKSNLPGGKTKTTITQRCGDLTKRTSRIDSPSIRIKKPKAKKLSRKESKALGQAISFLILLPFKILKWLFK